MPSESTEPRYVHLGLVPPSGHAWAPPPGLEAPGAQLARSDAAVGVVSPPPGVFCPLRLGAWDVQPSDPEAHYAAACAAYLAAASVSSHVASPHGSPGMEATLA